MNDCSSMAWDRQLYMRPLQLFPSIVYTVPTSSSGWLLFVSWEVFASWPVVAVCSFSDTVFSLSVLDVSESQVYGRLSSNVSQRSFLIFPGTVYKWCMYYLRKIMCKLASCMFVVSALSAHERSCIKCQSNHQIGQVERRAHTARLVVQIRTFVPIVSTGATILPLIIQLISTGSGCETPRGDHVMSDGLLGPRNSTFLQE